jgi:hypothetical protein
MNTWVSKSRITSSQQQNRVNVAASGDGERLKSGNGVPTTEIARKLQIEILRT